MALNQVPQSNQTLAQTQNPILTNFSVIDSAFSVDHVDYNSPSQGKHNKVTMPVQIAGPTTSSSELALYTKDVSGLPQLFLRRQSNGTEIDITSSAQSLNGWTRLPSGILLKWGNFTANSNTTTSISFPVGAGIPVFSAIYNVQCTSLNGSGSANLSPQLTNILVTAFDIYPRQIGLGSGNGPFSYVAIGI